MENQEFIKNFKERAEEKYNVLSQDFDQLSQSHEKILGQLQKLILSSQGDEVPIHSLVSLIPSPRLM